MYEYFTFLCIDISLKHVRGFVFRDNLTISLCASVGVYQWYKHIEQNEYY